MTPTAESLFALDQIPAADVAALHTCAQGCIDDILRGFYTKVAATPELARKFAGQERMDHAAEMQKKHWLGSLFAGAWNDAFRDQAARIGHIHQKVGLGPDIYVGAYSHVGRALIDALVADADESTQAMGGVAKALLSIVLYDVSIVIEGYIAEEASRRRDAEERAQEAMEETIASFEADLAGTIQTLAGAAQQIESSANVFLQDSQSTRQRSERLQTDAGALTETAGRIQDISARASQQLGESLKTTQAVVEAASQLADATAEITSIVDLIGAVSAKTRLLALNASIEAARAGEAGKGFNVVAQEVKALANQTADQSARINDHVEAIQAMVGKVSSDVDGAARTSREVVSWVERILATVAEQVSAADSVRASSHALLETAVQTGSGATQSLAATRELTRQARQLQQKGDGFLHKLRQGTRKAGRAA